MQQTPQGAARDGEGAEHVAAQALARWSDRPGPLLPILHEIQQAVGYIPAEVVPQIARGLNLSRAEVHGVISYYHHFRTEAPARHVIQVCRAESCQAMGAEALYGHVLRRTGCEGQGEPGHACRGADGRYQVEPVYCLGLCAASPAVMIGQTLHARVDAARFDACIDALEEDKR
jgi:formate dehydrogenase subunit gamma